MSVQYGSLNPIRQFGWIPTKILENKTRKGPLEQILPKLEKVGPNLSFFSCKGKLSSFKKY